MIVKITIEVAPAPGTESHRHNRVIEFDGTTKRWTGYDLDPDAQGARPAQGLYPGEAQFIAAFDKIRSTNPL